MNFGQAIEALKEGKLVTRPFWNGKGMFIFLRPGDSIQAGDISKIKSLPQSVKDWVEFEDTKETGSEKGIWKIEFTPYICMKSADGKIVNGWLASQTDMLADDWTLYNPHLA
jgi:hypothetical protein